MRKINYDEKTFLYLLAALTVAAIAFGFLLGVAYMMLNK